MKNLIDLHLHLDGSLSINNIRKLADCAGLQLSLSDGEIKKKLSVDENCRDLNEYLEKFDYPLSFLQTAKQISDCVKNFEDELLSLGYIYVEIRFAPQLHLQNGLSQRDVVLAAIDGNNRSALRANLILCTMRGRNNRDANLETVKVASEFLGKGVCAVDLAGAEALFPTCDHRYVFDLASSLNVPFTIHAGEADGPQSVWDAISFGAKRIGHGVRSTEDPILLKELKRRDICLELCPTSNLNTNIFSSYSEYPIRTFMEYDIPFSICSDNMSVSSTDAIREFDIISDTFSLSEQEKKSILLNEIRYSFADDDLKRELENTVQLV